MKKIEILLKNLFLYWLLFAGRRRKSSDKIELATEDKVLCIRLNRIGDALVVTPFIHELVKRTGCKVDVLADRHNHFVFRNNPDINRVIVFEKGAGNTKRVINEVNKGKYKVIIDLHDDVSVTVSYLLTKFKAKVIAGLKKANRSIYTNLILKPDPSKVHVIERSLSLLSLFNLENDSVNEVEPDILIKYFPTKDNISAVDRYFSSKLSGKKFIVGINISAGSSARYWGTENFKKLIKFIQVKDLDYLILCSTRDIKLGLELDPFSERTYYTPDFGEFCAMIGKLNLLFSPDTATVHLASIYKVPVFGLYVKYDTDDIIWYPYNTRFDSVVTTEPTLKNVKYSKVKEKFEPFLIEEIKRYENSGL
jgi:ADP-heptose:LPS heptosyltransferase